MKDYPRFYEELNPKQREAVDCIDGPVLVLAGPGTGKTQLLSVRAGSILDKAKVNPDNILILTYTNSAAKAMKERLAKVVGLEGYDLEVGTFHSFANSIIQESEEAANYAGDKIPLDDAERTQLAQYVLDNAKGIDEIHPFRAPYTYLDEILKKISDLKKDGVTPADLENYLDNKNNLYAQLDEKYIKRLRAFAIAYRMYEDLKEGKNKDIIDERGRYDFDDMILFATEALKKEKDLLKEYQEQYKYVMVDEYQDTNGAQLKLLFTLLDYKDPNLMCVGDDDQSIYRFQGASVGNFKILEKRFPKIKILHLKDNYRSSKDLIDISSRLINLIPSGERMADKALEPVREWKEKEILFREFTTEEEELEFIIDKVKELKDKISSDKNLTGEERLHPFNNIAVLARKRNDILKIIDAFLRAGIPYATDGKEDIAGEKRVRQMLDVLELAHIDPSGCESKDLVLYKVLSSDYFEIPHVDILALINFVNFKNAGKLTRRTTVLEELLGLSDRKDEIKFQKTDNVRRAARAISRLLTDARTRSVHSILMDFIKDVGLFGYILREYASGDVLRIRDLRGLGSFINMVKVADLAKPAIRLDEFMTDLKTRRDHGLPIRGDLVTLTQEGVRIYTAHGSKGLEFHSVIIPFCLQNRNWPARAIPEKIQLPSDLFKAKERAGDREQLKKLNLQDETRLFYVAMTRAKSDLIFTASPTEDAVSSFYFNSIDIQREGPEYLSEEEVIEKSLDMTDLKDPFIGTEEVLKDMVGNLSLNPTRLNNYITCRRRFLYNDVLKLPAAKKKSLVFGNCVHKALEKTYEKYKKTGKFPAFQLFKDAFTAELKFQGVDKVIEASCLNELEKMKNWFTRASKDPVMPIDLEKKLIVTIGDNIIFTGKYDKVEWEDEKKNLVRIIDYKTGRPDDHLKKIDACTDLASPDCDGYLRQLVCYRLLFERDKKESKSRCATHGVLQFVSEPVSIDMKKQGFAKGEYVSKRVAISDEMVKEVELVIKDVWANIKKLHFEKFPERDKDICRTCEFDSICWGKK